MKPEEIPRLDGLATQNKKKIEMGKRGGEHLPLISFSGNTNTKKIYFVFPRQNKFEKHHFSPAFHLYFLATAAAAISRSIVSSFLMPSYMVSTASTSDTPRRRLFEIS